MGFSCCCIAIGRAGAAATLCMSAGEAGLAASVTPLLTPRIAERREKRLASAAASSGRMLIALFTAERKACLQCGWSAETLRTC
jgi:hypothetical protein